MDKTKTKVIYDIVSVPRDMGLDFNDLMYMFKEASLLLWDSSSEGVEPKVFMDDGAEIQLIDTAKLSDKEKAEFIKKWKKW